MSKYTTGEIAKLCGVSVRTVQYYDTRGVLMPSELSEGGRRLYFGSKEVLRGLDLSVPEHSIYGFIGKNGAGKTTTMKAILGLLRPDSGEIYVMGEKVHFGQTGTNRYIGYLPDVPEFYSYMTPLEYLSLCGEVSGMDRADIAARSKELLELVGLGGEHRRIKGFSRGMKQRLGIAQALLNRPKLLICDEPTSALDPVGRKEILDILLAVKEQTTVLFSTHILSDVERICNESAFLKDGKIALQGTIYQLLNKRSSDGFIIETEQKKDAEMLINVFGDLRYTEHDALAFHGSGYCSRRCYRATQASPCVSAERCFSRTYWA